MAQGREGVVLGYEKKITPRMHKLENLAANRRNDLVFPSRCGMWWLGAKWGLGLSNSLFPLPISSSSYSFELLVSLASKS